ncbi:prepilin peptidase [Microbacterium sp. NPDC056736]|uniref:prepilin peptidase n=1 Tax=Microbacterium sp. NPDC056736 TaxID=3345932 RepID=UPI0036700478
MTQFEIFLVLLAGIVGLVIGSFLNVVAYRVPAGISLMRESRCPRCETPIKPWHNVPVIGWIALRGRCATCNAAISARYPLVEAITGVTFALVTWSGLAQGRAQTDAYSTNYSGATLFAFVLIVVAFLYFASISVALTLIDLETHRLPNGIVLPSYVVAGVLFTVASWLLGDWAALLRAASGMVILYVFYFLLRLVRPGGMGGGDVKLAGVIGLHLGWLGWGVLVVGAFAAFVFGGVFGIALMAVRRADRKTAIPFGPWMILGAWTGVFTGEVVGQWYTDLFIGA